MSNNNSLLLSRTRSKGGLLRAISASLIFCFLLQELASASPEPTKINWLNGADSEDSKKWAKTLLPTIPESLATIEDAYKAANSKKTVILIQDAHTNNSGQLNEARLLDILLDSRSASSVERQALKGQRHSDADRLPLETESYIFLEAGYGNESLSFLRKYASLEKRQQVAKSFLLQAKLQGTEYLDLTSKHAMTLWGVEDMPLYTQSVNLYKDIAKQRGKFKDYLDRVDHTIQTLKPNLLNPLLLSFTQTKRKHLKNEISSTDYIDYLLKQSRQLDIVCPKHLNALKDLKSKEKDIDFTAVQKEQADFIATLPKEEQQDLQNAAISKDQNIKKAFFAMLEERLAASSRRQTFYPSLRAKRCARRRFVAGSNLDFKSEIASVTSLPRNDDFNANVQYPNLQKYLTYFKSCQSLNPRQILKEQNELEEKILDSLIVTQEEREFVQSERLLGLLVKLFTLQMTPNEYQEYKKIKDQRSKIKDKAADNNDPIVSITGFLNKIIMNKQDYYDKALFLENGYEGMVKKCEEFYELTYERDKKFLDNMESALSVKRQAVKGNEDPDTYRLPLNAILITGGYHTPNLKYLLKQKNISYISLTPQVLQETNIKRYEEILLNQKIAPPLPNTQFLISAKTNMTMRTLESGRLVELTKGLDLSPEATEEVLTLAAARLAGGGEADRVEEEWSEEKISDKLAGLPDTIVAADNTVFTVSRRIWVDDRFLLKKINVRISLHSERAVTGFVDFYYEPAKAVAMIATNRFGWDDPAWVQGPLNMNDGDIGEAAIAVNPDPQFRRRRIGVTLLAIAYQAAHKLGAKEIRVNPGNNRNAVIFWDRAVKEKIIMKDPERGYLKFPFDPAQIAIHGLNWPKVQIKAPMTGARSATKALADSSALVSAARLAGITASSVKRHASSVTEDPRSVIVEGSGSTDGARLSGDEKSINATQVQELDGWPMASAMRAQRYRIGREGAATASAMVFEVTDPSRVTIRQLHDKKILKRDLSKEDSRLTRDDGDNNIVGKTYAEWANLSGRPEAVLLTAPTAESGLLVQGGFLIVDGEIVARTAPAFFGEEGGWKPLSGGPFSVVSLDPERPGIFDVYLENGRIIGDCPVRNGFSGALLLDEGESQLDKIHFKKPEMMHGPNFVAWPRERRFALSAYVIKDGHLALVQAWEDSGQGGITVDEFVHFLKAIGVKKAILTAASTEVGAAYAGPGREIVYFQTPKPETPSPIHNLLQRSTGERPVQAVAVFEEKKGDTGVLDHPKPLVGEGARLAGTDPAGQTDASLLLFYENAFYQPLLRALLKATEFPDPKKFAALQSQLDISHPDKVDVKLFDGTENVGLIYPLETPEAIADSHRKFDEYIDFVFGGLPQDLRKQVRTLKVGSPGSEFLAHFSSNIFFGAKAVDFTRSRVLGQPEKLLLKKTVGEVASETSQFMLPYLGHGIGGDGTLVRFYDDPSGEFAKTGLILKEKADTLLREAGVLLGDEQTSAKPFPGITVGRIAYVPPLSAEQKKEVVRRAAEYAERLHREWIQNHGLSQREMLTVDRMRLFSEKKLMTAAYGDLNQDHRLTGARFAQPKTYAITGGTGAIGSQLIRHLLSLSDTKEILVLVRHKEDADQESKDLLKIASSNSKIKIVYGDLTSYQALEELVTRSDVIYHLGGWAGLGVPDEEEALAVNSLSSAILDALAERHNKKMIFASTIEVYMLGQKRSGTVREEDLILAEEYSRTLEVQSRAIADTVREIMAKPSQDIRALYRTIRGGASLGDQILKNRALFYAATKYLAEQSLKKSVILRLGAVYGPGDESKERQIPMAIRKMAPPDPQPMQAWPKQSPWTYSDDLVKMLKTAADEPIAEEDRIIAVVGDRQVPQKELFDQIREITASPHEVTVVESKELLLPPLSFDPARMQRVLHVDVQKLTPLGTGLRGTKRWLLDASEQEKWVAPEGARLAGGRNSEMVFINQKPKQAAALVFDWDETVCRHILNVARRVQAVVIAQIWAGKSQPSRADIRRAAKFFDQNIRYRDSERFEMAMSMSNPSGKDVRFFKAMYDQQVEAAVSAEVDRWSKHPDRYLKPGMRAFLEECRNRGVPMYIVSKNGYLLSHSIPAKLGISEYFVKILAPTSAEAINDFDKSEAIESVKREVRITGRRRGRVIYFDDQDYGIADGKKAGAYGVKVSDAPKAVRAKEGVSSDAVLYGYYQDASGLANDLNIPGVAARLSSQPPLFEPYEIERLRLRGELLKDVHRIVGEEARRFLLRADYLPVFLKMDKPGYLSTNDEPDPSILHGDGVLTTDLLDRMDLWCMQGSSFSVGDFAVASLKNTQLFKDFDLYLDGDEEVYQEIANKIARGEKVNHEDFLSIAQDGILSPWRVAPLSALSRFVLKGTYCGYPESGIRYAVSKFFSGQAGDIKAIKSSMNIFRVERYDLAWYSDDLSSPENVRLGRRLTLTLDYAYALLGTGQLSLTDAEAQLHAAVSPVQTKPEARWDNGARLSRLDNGFYYPSQAEAKHVEITAYESDSKYVKKTQYTQYFGHVYSDLSEYLDKQGINEKKIEEIINAERQSIVIGIPTYDDGENMETQIENFREIVRQIKKFTDKPEYHDWPIRLVINVNGIGQEKLLKEILKFQRFEATDRVPITVLYMPLDSVSDGKPTSGKTDPLNSIVEYSKSIGATIWGSVDNDVRLSEDNISSNIKFLIEASRKNKTVVLTGSAPVAVPGKSWWSKMFTPRGSFAIRGSSMFSFLAAVPPFPSQAINDDVYFMLYFDDARSFSPIKFNWRVCQNPNAKVYYRVADKFMELIKQRYRWCKADQLLRPMLSRDKQNLSRDFIEGGFPHFLRGLLSGKNYIVVTFRYLIYLYVKGELILGMVTSRPVKSVNWRNTIAKSSKRRLDLSETDEYAVADPPREKLPNGARFAKGVLTDFAYNSRGQKVVFKVDLPDRTKFSGNRPVALLFHSFFGNKNNYWPAHAAKELVNNGYLVVRPDFTNMQHRDYPGNESEGNMADYFIEGSMSDVRAVVGVVLNKFSNLADFSDVTVGGYCGGGIIARNVTAEAYSRPDSILSRLKITSVIDISGVISPAGTMKASIEKFYGKNGSMSRFWPETWSYDEVLAAWEKQGKDFGIFGGQVYEIRGLEKYRAVEALDQIPNHVRYIHILPQDDDIIRCSNFPEAHEVEEFIGHIEMRPLHTIITDLGDSHTSFMTNSASADSLGKLLIKSIGQVSDGRAVLPGKETVGARLANPIDALSYPNLSRFIRDIFIADFSPFSVLVPGQDVEDLADRVLGALRSYQGTDREAARYVNDSVYSFSSIHRDKRQLWPQFVEGEQNIFTYLTGLLKGPAFLDVGAGGGGFTRMLADKDSGQGSKKFTRLVETDVTDFRYDRASPDPRIEFYLQTSQLIPADAIGLESMDSVRLSWMLHHAFENYPDPDDPEVENLIVSFFKEVYRVTKPEGIVQVIEDTYPENRGLFSTVVPDIASTIRWDKTEEFMYLSTREKYLFLVWMDWFTNVVRFGHYEDLQMAYRFYSMERWLQLFKRTSFEVVRQEYWGIQRHFLHSGSHGLFLLRKPGARLAALDLPEAEFNQKIAEPLQRLLDWNALKDELPGQCDVIWAMGSDSLETAVEQTRLLRQYRQTRGLVTGGIGTGSRPLSYWMDDRVLEDKVLHSRFVREFKMTLAEWRALYRKSPDEFWQSMNSLFGIRPGADWEKYQAHQAVVAAGKKVSGSMSWQEVFEYKQKEAPLVSEMRWQGISFDGNENAIEKKIFECLLSESPEEQNKVWVPEGIVYWILLKAAGISEDRIIIEAVSTTSRENIGFGWARLEAQGVTPDSLILVQNAISQRRGVGAFQNVSRDLGKKAVVYSRPAGVINVEALLRDKERPAVIALAKRVIGEYALYEKHLSQGKVDGIAVTEGLIRYLAGLREELGISAARFAENEALSVVRRASSVEPHALSVKRQALKGNKDPNAYRLTPNAGDGARLADDRSNTETWHHQKPLNPYASPALNLNQQSNFKADFVKVAKAIVLYTVSIGSIGFVASEVAAYFGSFKRVDDVVLFAIYLERISIFIFRFGMGLQAFLWLFRSTRFYPHIPLAEIVDKEDDKASLDGTTPEGQGSEQKGARLATAPSKPNPWSPQSLWSALEATVVAMMPFYELKLMSLATAMRIQAKAHTYTGFLGDSQGSDTVLESGWHILYLLPLILIRRAVHWRTKPIQNDSCAVCRANAQENGLRLSWKYNDTYQIIPQAGPAKDGLEITASFLVVRAGHRPPVMGPYSLQDMIRFANDAGSGYVVTKHMRQKDAAPEHDAFKVLEQPLPFQGRAALALTELQATQEGVRILRVSNGSGNPVVFESENIEKLEEAFSDTLRLFDVNLVEYSLSIAKTADKKIRIYLEAKQSDTQELIKTLRVSGVEAVKDIDFSDMKEPMRLDPKTARAIANILEQVRKGKTWAKATGVVLRRPENRGLNKARARLIVEGLQYYVKVSEPRHGKHPFRAAHHLFNHGNGAQIKAFLTRVFACYFADHSERIIPQSKELRVCMALTSALSPGLESLARKYSETLQVENERDRLLAQRQIFTDINLEFLSCQGVVIGRDYTNRERTTSSMTAIASNKNSGLIMARIGGTSTVFVKARSIASSLRFSGGQQKLGTNLVIFDLSSHNFTEVSKISRDDRFRQTSLSHLTGIFKRVCESILSKIALFKKLKITANTNNLDYHEQQHLFDARDGTCRHYCDNDIEEVSANLSGLSVDADVLQFAGVATSESLSFYERLIWHRGNRSKLNRMYDYHSQYAKGLDYLVAALNEKNLNPDKPLPTSLFQAMKDFFYLPTRLTTRRLNRLTFGYYQKWMEMILFRAFLRQLDQHLQTIADHLVNIDEIKDAAKRAYVHVFKKEPLGGATGFESVSRPLQEWIDSQPKVPYIAAAAKLAGNSASSVERRTSSVERRALSVKRQALKGNRDPNAYRLTPNARDGARLAAPTTVKLPSYLDIDQNTLARAWDDFDELHYLDSWHERRMRRYLGESAYAELSAQKPEGVELLMGPHRPSSEFEAEGWHVTYDSARDSDLLAHKRRSVPSIYRLEREGSVRYVFTGILSDHNIYQTIGMLKLLKYPVGKVRIDNPKVSRRQLLSQKLSGVFKGVDTVVMGLSSLLGKKEGEYVHADIPTLEERLVAEGWSVASTHEDTIYSFKIYEKGARRIAVASLDQMVGDAATDFADELYSQNVRSIAFWGTASGFGAGKSDYFKPMKVARVRDIFGDAALNVTSNVSFSPSAEHSVDNLSVYGLYDEHVSRVSGYASSDIVTVEMELYRFLEWGSRHTDIKIRVLLNLAEVFGSKADGGAMNHMPAEAEAPDGVAARTLSINQGRDEMMDFIGQNAAAARLAGATINQTLDQVSPDSLDRLWQANRESGFIKPVTDENGQATEIHEETVGPYTVIDIPAKRISTKNAPTTTCKLCRENNKQENHRDEWGRWQISPNPAYLRSMLYRHFVILLSAHENQHPICRDDIRDMLRFSQKAGSKYSIFMNAEFAASSIPGHKHFQAVEYPFPVMDSDNFPLLPLDEKDNVKTYATQASEIYPSAIKVYESDNLEALAFAVGYDIDLLEASEYRGFSNLLFHHRPDGKWRVYLAVHSPEKLRIDGSYQLIGALTSFGLFVRSTAAPSLDLKSPFTVEDANSYLSKLLVPSVQAVLSQLLVTAAARLASKTSHSLIQGLKESYRRRVESLRREQTSKQPSLDALILLNRDPAASEANVSYFNSLRSKKGSRKVRTDIPVVSVDNGAFNYGSAGMLVRGVAEAKRLYDRTKQRQKEKVHIPRNLRSLNEARSFYDLRLGAVLTGGSSTRFTAFDKQDVRFYPAGQDRGSETIKGMSVQSLYPLTQNLLDEQLPGLLISAGDILYLSDVPPIRDGANLFSSPESLVNAAGRFGVIVSGAAGRVVRFDEKESKAALMSVEAFNKAVSAKGENARVLPANTASSLTTLHEQKKYKKFINGLLAIARFIDRKALTGEVYPVDISNDFWKVAVMKSENEVERYLADRFSGDKKKQKYYRYIYSVVRRTFPKLYTSNRDPERTFFMDIGFMRDFHDLATNPDNPFYQAWGLAERRVETSAIPADVRVAVDAAVYESVVRSGSQIGSRVLVYISDLHEGSVVGEKSAVIHVTGEVHTAPGTLLALRPVKSGKSSAQWAAVYSGLDDALTLPLGETKIGQRLIGSATAVGEAFIKTIEMEMGMKPGEKISPASSLSSLPIWPVFDRPEDFDMSVVEWMFTTSIAPKKYLSMRRISYDEMVKQWDIEAINQYERGVLESVFKMKQKKSAKVALNGARLAGNTAFSVERHASSVERRALKGGNPTAYRLTLAAKDNGFLSSSRSHLASGPDIDTFLTLVANHNLSPQGGQGRLPVLIGDIVEIYSLKRDQNILIVETQDGQHKVLDLSKGTIEDFNHAKHQGALVREKALEEDLFKLHEADSIPSPSSPNTNTRTLMIHLDGFGKNKGAISNLLKKADERIQGNTQVYLAGQPEEIATAESLLRELSLKHKARLSTASPDPQSQLLLTHLVPVNELEALKAHFRDKHPKITNQWVSMESLISREDGRVGVFSFSSVTSLLELVASGDLESATSFFNQITGYKVSTEEFKALIQGDIQLAHKYPIQPILKTALRDAERLYILSRSFTTSA